MSQEAKQMIPTEQVRSRKELQIRTEQVDDIVLLFAEKAFVFVQSAIAL